MKEKQYSLLLSKNYEPLQVLTAKKAMSLLCSDKVMALEPTTYQTFTFDEWVDNDQETISNNHNISTEKRFITIPEIVVTKSKGKLFKVPKRRISKRKVFERDGYKCGYCGKTVNSDNKTIDHIIPSSKGGTNTYDNVVTACWSCNHKKGNKLLDQLGWKLIYTIGDPFKNVIHSVGEKYRLKSWEVFCK